MTDVFDLLERYNQPTPRYTSYPPVPHWHAGNEHHFVSAMRDSAAPLSIYAHIPFCERLCLYCGCNTVIKKDHSVAAPYIQNLIREMDLAEVAHRRLVTQIHWGGGTPTYLDPDQIRKLFAAIAERFCLARRRVLRRDRSESHDGRSPPNAAFTRVQPVEHRYSGLRRERPAYDPPAANVPADTGAIRERT
jgi:hypothetical protein